MRTLLIALLVLCPLLGLFGQSIDYSVPKDLQKKISSEDYNKILGQSLAAIRQRMTVTGVKSGAIDIVLGDKSNTLYIDVLVGECLKAKSKADWSKIIKAHFDDMFAGIDMVKTLDRKDFDAVGRYLSLRIFADTYVEKVLGLDKVMARKDLEGTYTVLMLDLPSGFEVVDTANFNAWKKGPTEVFSMAQSNINGIGPEKTKQELNASGNKLSVTTITDDDNAASYALDLGTNSPELVGDLGAVLAVPGAGSVTVLKLTKEQPRDFQKFIEASKGANDKAFTSQAHPISRQFYWYYQGKFTVIDLQAAADNKLTIIAPSALSALLPQ